MKKENDLVLKKVFKSLMSFCFCIFAIGLFLFSVYPAVNETLNHDYNCYDNTQCSKYNLDEFNNCIDIGLEGCGFLCENHYYLCDKNIKITKKCIEYKQVRRYNVTIFDYGRLNCTRMVGGK